MDIEILKTFLEVIRTRHFGKAAENLYVTQSAVSARIKQLEDNLGVKVFTRTRNDLQLTPEGKRLVPYAESVLSSWVRARQELTIKSEQVSRLSIGTTAGLWNYVIQDRLPDIYQELPEISLRALACSSEDMMRLIMDRSLDIAISYENIDSPELSSQAIGKLKLVLCSSELSVQVKDAMASNYVYVDWGTAFGVFHAKQFGESPPAALHTNMATIAESFITNGSGAAYLPEVLLDKNRNQGLHKVRGAPEYYRNLYITYLADSEAVLEISKIKSYLSI